MVPGSLIEEKLYIMHRDFDGFSFHFIDIMSRVVNLFISITSQVYKRKIINNTILIVIIWHAKLVK